MISPRGGVETHPYTLSAVRQMSGLSRHAIARLVELGFIHPLAVEKGYRYSFQDAVLLRSASELRAANIPTRRILDALRRLREHLPSEAPRGALRITAESGMQVAVRTGSLQWEPATGQMTLDLQVGVSKGGLRLFGASEEAQHHPDAEVEPSLDALFARAELQEDVNREAAEALYREILSLDAGHAHAYLNLGFMLCEDERFEEAVALYSDAQGLCGDDPLIHFNRAVALEAVGKMQDALQSYEQSIRLDPELLDAHQNAALLYAQVGEQQLAIRHFSAYRRLTARR